MFVPLLGLGKGGGRKNAPPPPLRSQLPKVLSVSSCRLQSLCTALQEEMSWHGPQRGNLPGFIPEAPSPTPSCGGSPGGNWPCSRLQESMKVGSKTAPKRTRRSRSGSGQTGRLPDWGSLKETDCTIGPGETGSDKHMCLSISHKPLPQVLLVLVEYK